MIIDKTVRQPERFPRTTIAPKPGNARMRCGTCGGMDFEIHLAPSLDGSCARIDEVVCLSCTNVRRADELAGTKKVTDADHISQLPNSIRAADLRKANGSH